MNPADVTTLGLKSRGLARDRARQPLEALDLQPPPFAEDAACASVDPDLWFPEKGGTTRPAKEVCGRCPVRAECLAYALERKERFGIWGGLSERERRRLVRAA